MVCGTVNWLLAWVRGDAVLLSMAARVGSAWGAHNHQTEPQSQSCQLPEVVEGIKYFRELIFQSCYSKVLKAVFHVEGTKRWKMFLEEVGVGFYWVHFCSGGQLKRILPQKLLTLKAISHLKLWLDMIKMVFAVLKVSRRKCVRHLNLPGAETLEVIHRSCVGHTADTWEWAWWVG